MILSMGTACPLFSDSISAIRSIRVSILLRVEEEVPTMTTSISSFPVSGSIPTCRKETDKSLTAASASSMEASLRRAIRAWDSVRRINDSN